MSLKLLQQHKHSLEVQLRDSVDVLVKEATPLITQTLSLNTTQTDKLHHAIYLCCEVLTFSLVVSSGC